MASVFEVRFQRLSMLCWFRSLEEKDFHHLTHLFSVKIAPFIVIITRFLFLFFGSGAIVSSVFSVYSCEFFSYRSLDGQPWEGLTPPFDELASASVGLFRYSATISDGSLFGESCVNYEDWTDVGDQVYFYAAQWCSLIAPVAAFLALLQITCECLFCRLKGSYMLNRFLFISASTLQMCSFLVFSETQFW